MEKCPVCGCEKENRICQNCGYDESKDIIEYRTVRKPSGVEKKEFQQFKAQGDQNRNESRVQEIDQLLEELKIRQQELEREKADIKNDKLNLTEKLSVSKADEKGGGKKADVTKEKAVVKSSELKLSLKEEIKEYWLLLVTVIIVTIIWEKWIGMYIWSINASVWSPISVVLWGLLYASLVYSLWKRSEKFCICWSAIYIASGSIFVMYIGFVDRIKLFVIDIVLLLSAKYIIIIIKEVLMCGIKEDFAMAVSSLAVTCTIPILQYSLMYVTGFLSELYFEYNYTHAIELAATFIFTYMLRNLYRSK